MPALPAAAAACPHFPRCPGCPLVGRPYAAQLAWKRDVVRQAFAEAVPPARIGDIIAPVEPAVATCGYRVQAKLMIDVRRAGLVIGLYRAGTHHVDDASGCPLHDPLLTAAVAAGPLPPGPGRCTVPRPGRPPARETPRGPG